MNPVLRNTLATIAGLLVGSAANMAIISLNTALHPAPAGLDTNDPAQFAKYVATLPVLALVLVIIAHLAQAFVGGWLAARLAATRPMLCALIVGALSLAGGITMLTMVPHPPWMWIEAPLYLIVAWLAGRIEFLRRTRVAC